MRAVWTGSISFGLVSIPVRLYPANWSPEEYEDRDRARLMELIGSRAPRDLEPDAEEPVSGPAVSELMQALKASVEAVADQKSGRKTARRSKR